MMNNHTNACKSDGELDIEGKAGLLVDYGYLIWPVQIRRWVPEAHANLQESS